MKIRFFLKSAVIFSLLMLMLNSCDKNNSSDTDTDTEMLTDKDKEAMLFMLEEEKLARDTYMFLDAKWPNNPFANIIGSEQSHMDAIASLLDANKIAYTILPVGQFSETDLQDYYNQFIADGVISSLNALKIGATIEDLDIVDLQEYIEGTSNISLIDVFSLLECGSRNHLRSFYKSIMLLNETYTPQFLTLEEYNSIVTSENEKCNQ